jgi:hypothetical protein
VLDDRQRAFIAQNGARSTAMVTLRHDGTPHAVRVGIVVVDGKIWSSGTRTRRRTAHLKRDPRSTLSIFDAAWQWLSLECRVTILDGPDAPALNLQLSRAMLPDYPAGRMNWFGRDVSEDEFLQIMVDEQRLVYEFDVLRAYGMHA